MRPMNRCPPIRPSGARRLQTLALQRQPKVLARFEGDGASAVPGFAADRPGRSDLLPPAAWLRRGTRCRTTNAIVAFDRILRSQMQATLPRAELCRPRAAHAAAGQRRAEPDACSLARPGHNEADEPLDVGYIGTAAESGASGA